MHEFDNVSDWLDFAEEWADEQAGNMYETLHEAISSHIQSGYESLRYPLVLQNGEHVSKIPPQEILEAFVEMKSAEERLSIFEIDPDMRDAFEGAKRYAILVPNGNPFTNALNRFSRMSHLKRLFDMD